MNIAERHERIRELAAQGLTQERIAARLFVAEITVRRDMKKAGIPSGCRISDERLAAAKQLLDAGRTYPETARATGIGISTLHRRLPGYKIDQTTASRKAGIASGVVRRQRATARWLHDHRHIVTMAPVEAP